MLKEEFTYLSKDGKTTIHAIEWRPKGRMIGILQIAHGVTEYIERYENLARYLTSKGFVVVGNDHLGHGKSIATCSVPMYFGPKNSWFWASDDIHTCYQMTKEKFPDIPYFLLGFSLGSFLVRTFLIDHPECPLMGTILMGTGQASVISTRLGMWMANREIKKVGANHSSTGIDQLTFGTYNKMFRPNKTKFDWLCANEKSVMEYVEDPNRGDSFTAGLLKELLNGMSYSGKTNNIQKMNKNIPILFLSGKEDPVGGRGKGVQATYNKFYHAKIRDIELKIYPKLRHDILHEEIKDSIYDDLYDWLKRKVSEELKN